jgi:hypothetical protein
VSLCTRLLAVCHQRVIVEDIGVDAEWDRIVWWLKGIQVKRGIDFGIDFGAPMERIIHFPDKMTDHDVDTRQKLEGINPPFAILYLYPISSSNAQFMGSTHIGTNLSSPPRFPL